MRRMTSLAVFSGVALLAWFAAAAGLDGLGRRDPPQGIYDALVVAGCRVDPNGQPSLALQRRTKLAVDLWRAGVAPVVVFTGGLGAFPPSEATAAATYAAGLGLPVTATLLEDQSTSTEENAKFAAALLRQAQRPAARILVVTDAYHVFRATRVFGRYFPEVVGAGSTPAWGVRMRGALREVLALAFYAATGRLRNETRQDES